MNAYTEAEAKSKTCPIMGQVKRLPPPGMDNIFPATEQARCIASACMAWRWIQKDGPVFYENEPGKFFYSHGRSDWIAMAEARGLKRVDRDGFCGLAGTP
jgi:hypothetical protein